jgi:hypothetical protein
MTVTRRSGTAVLFALHHRVAQEEEAPPPRPPPPAPRQCIVTPTALVWLRVSFVKIDDKKSLVNIITYFRLHSPQATLRKQCSRLPVQAEWPP